MCPMVEKRHQEDRYAKSLVRVATSMMAIRFEGNKSDLKFVVSSMWGSLT